MSALYRRQPGEDWQAVEIVGRHSQSGGWIVREVARLWPGIILAWPDQVRVEGPILELREPFGNETRAA